MPLCWDLSETELYKKKDSDKWHKEAWKYLFKNLNPNKPYTDKNGIKYIPLKYDLLFLLTSWTYSKKRGSYGERGKEMLEGKYFVFEERDIEKFKKEVGWQGDDKILHKVVGLKVWAYRGKEFVL